MRSPMLRDHPFPAPGDNREPEPCPEDECRHAHDGWPVGSVTQSDLEYDQCESCGWTAAEVSKLRLVVSLPRPRTATLRGVHPIRPPELEETVVVDTYPEDEITEVMPTPRAVCERCGYRARHVQAFPGGLCGGCRDDEATK